MPSTDIMADDLRELRRLVDEQAEMASLWSPAKTHMEEHLQHTLRELHDMIERATRWMPEATTTPENG